MLQELGQKTLEERRKEMCLTVFYKILYGEFATDGKDDVVQIRKSLLEDGSTNTSIQFQGHLLTTTNIHSTLGPSYNETYYERKAVL